MSTKGEERLRKTGHPRAGIFKASVMGPTSPREFDEARRTKGVLAAREAIGANSPDEAITILRKNKSMRALYYSVLDSHGINHS